MKPIEYFVVPSSPWAYLGHDRFVSMARRHGSTIALKPFDLGRVFPLSGGLPLPKRAPQRQVYRLVELARWSRHLGVPLNLHPRHFPVSAELASLAIISADQLAGTEGALALTGRIMAALWAHERDIADPAVIAALALEVGLNPDAMHSRTDDARARYEHFTQEAIDAGVFGAPWYRYRDEPFWGQDRLDFLDRALAAG